MRPAVDDLKTNIEQVLKNNLKSGSYVLEQDGSISNDSVMTQGGTIKPELFALRTQSEQRNTTVVSRNNVQISKQSATDTSANGVVG